MLISSKLVTSLYDFPQYSLIVAYLASLFASISCFEKCYHTVSYIGTLREEISLEQRKERFLDSIK